MTACLSNARQKLQALAPARRGNLLALEGCQSAAALALQWPSLQRLQQLGYAVREIQPEHWLLTLAGSPLQIHLYGATELADFTRGRACTYSVRAARAGAVTRSTQPHPDHF